MILLFSVYFGVVIVWFRYLVLCYVGCVVLRIWLLLLFCFLGGLFGYGVFGLFSCYGLFVLCFPLFCVCSVLCIRSFMLACGFALYFLG